MHIAQRFRFIADRTRNFKCALSDHMQHYKFPHEKLRAFADFVLKVCPQLKKFLVE